MQACLISEKGQVGIQDVPVPVLNRGEVLIRLASAGVCGTDIEKAQGGYGPGGILGHEVSGTVERIGQGVTGLELGDRVLAHHHVPCYACKYCLVGDHTMCDLFRKTNFDPCGLAEFFRVPETNVIRGAIIPLPSSMSFDEAALIEPTACCVRALVKAAAKPRESVVVVGLGPAGLTQIQLLEDIGAAPILGADILAHRREKGLELGALEAIDTSKIDLSEAVNKSTDGGADLVIVSTGNPKAIQLGLTAVRRGGRLLLFGAPARGSKVELDAASLFSHQISIVTSYSCIESDIHAAIDLVSRKDINLRSMVTDTFPLGDAPKAIENARISRTAIKTVIRSYQ